MEPQSPEAEVPEPQSSSPEILEQKPEQVTIALEQVPVLHPTHVDCSVPSQSGGRPQDGEELREGGGLWGQGPVLLPEQHRLSGEDLQVDGTRLGDLGGDEAPVGHLGGREQAESHPGEPLLRPGVAAQEARKGWMSVRPHFALAPLSSVRHSRQVISEQIDSEHTC